MLTMCCPGVASSAQGVVQALSGRLSNMAVASGGMVATETLRYGLDDKSGSGWRGLAPAASVLASFSVWALASIRSAASGGVPWGCSGGGMALGFFSSGAGAEGAAGCGAGGWATITGAFGLDWVSQGAACQAINDTRPAATRTAKSTGRISVLRRERDLVSAVELDRETLAGRRASTAVGRSRLPPRGSGFQPLAAAQAASRASTNFWQLG